MHCWYNDCYLQFIKPLFVEYISDQTLINEKLMIMSIVGLSFEYVSINLVIEDIIYWW